MKYIRLIFSSIVLFTLCQQNVLAATIYWRPTVANGNGRYEWTNLNNWSTTTGIPYVHPAAIPGNTDKAVIDYSTAHTIEVNTTVSVQDLTIQNKTASDATILTLYATADQTITVLRNFNIGVATVGASKCNIASSPSTLSWTFIHMGDASNTPAGNIQQSIIDCIFAIQTKSILINKNLFKKNVLFTYSNIVHLLSNGGNEFLNDFSLVHNSSLIIYFGNTNRDIFRGEVLVQQLSGSGGSVILASSSSNAANEFYNKITLKSATGGGAIVIGSNAVGTIQTQFYDNACVYANETDHVAGGIMLYNIKQASSNTFAHTISTTSNSSVTFGPAVELYGTVTVRAANINLNGGADYGGATSNIFHDLVSLDYSGVISTTSSGGNTFKNGLTMTTSGNNASSTVYTIGFSNVYNDLVEGLLTVNVNMNNGWFFLGQTKKMKVQSKAGSLIDGGVVINMEKNGLVAFGYGAASLFEISNQLPITTGTFDRGTITFKKFAHTETALDPNNSNAATNINITGTNNATVRTDAGITFGSGVLINAGTVNLFSVTCKEDVLLNIYDNTSTSNIYGTCLFGKKLTCNVLNTTATSSGLFYVGASTSNITIKGDLILEQIGDLGLKSIIVANDAVSNVLIEKDLYVRNAGNNLGTTIAYLGACRVNGNIFVSKLAGGNGNGGINLGFVGVLSHYGEKVEIESGKFFNNGILAFRKYFQMDENAQASASGVDIFALSGTVKVPINGTVSILNRSLFYSKVEIIANRFNLYGGQFYNTSKFTYALSTIEQSSDFYLPTEFNYSGSAGYTNFTTSSSINNFYDDAVFNCTAPGGYEYFGTGTGGVLNFYKNYTYNAVALNTPILNGSLYFLGSSDQYVNYSTATITFQHPIINKPSGKLYIQKDITITGNANFTKGIVVVPSSNLATFNSGSVVQSQGLTSYIDGRAKKIGNVAFTFPIGKGRFYAPIAISAPANVAAAITTEYMLGAHPSTYVGTLPTTMPDISNVAYWTLSCPTTYSSSIAVTLPWNGTSYAPINKSVMTVARYASSVWTDAGNPSNSSIDTYTGSVTSTASTAFVGDYTLGYKTAVLLNTLNLYPVQFKTSGANIDLFRDGILVPPIEFISTSGAYPVLPYMRTRLANQNPTKMVIHPSINTSCAQIDVIADPTNPYYNPFSMCLLTDGGGNVNNIKTATGANDFSSDYYTYTAGTRELVLYPNKKPDGAVKIANNLLNGSVWKKASNPTLTFTVGGNVFAYADLKVKSVVTGLYLTMGTVTYASGVLSWNGSSIPADGLYIYELSLGSVANGSGATVYTGNMVVKTAE